MDTHAGTSNVARDNKFLRMLIETVPVAANAEQTQRSLGQFGVHPAKNVHLICTMSTARYRNLAFVCVHLWTLERK